MHPQQKNCDPNKKKEMAAWVWAAGVPDPRDIADVRIPLVLPQLCEGISEMLWDFGFRHHPDLQKRWIDGVGAVGVVAAIVKEPPQGDFLETAGPGFLLDNNPELAEMIKNASPEDKAKLLEDLEKNFRELQALMKMIEGS
jgi:hypothetical protein